MSHSWLEEPGFDMLRLTYDMNDQLRDGPFDIQGGAGIFLKKIICFHTGEKK